MGGRINMGWSWQRALAGLGGHMQQQSMENQRAAREQARMQAQMQNQMALEQMRAQREAERYRTLDARAERDYQFRQKQAEAQRAYQENMWKAQQENYGADNKRADRELQWKIDQAAEREAQRKAQAQAMQAIFAPVPPPMSASGGGMAPPIAPPSGTAPTDEAPPPTPPVGTSGGGNPMNSIDAEIASLQQAGQAGLFETPSAAFSARSRITELENAKRDQARQRQRDLLDTHERLFDMSNKIKGGGKDEDTDLTTGDLDFGMAIEQRKRDPMNKRKSLVAKLNDLYANNDGKEKTQKQIADLEKQIADFDKAAGGSVPDPQTFYNTARAYKTGQVPPALAADTTGSGTLMSHPGARAALEQGENPDVVRRALEIMQQGR